MLNISLTIYSPSPFYTDGLFLIFTPIILSLATLIEMPTELFLEFSHAVVELSANQVAVDCVDHEIM